MVVELVGFCDGVVVVYVEGVVVGGDFFVEVYGFIMVVGDGCDGYILVVVELVYELYYGYVGEFDLFC